METEEELKQLAFMPHNFFRCSTDVWYFGALLTTGETIPFETLTIREFEGIKWADLSAHRGGCSDFNFNLGKLRGAGINRNTITVNLNHIVAIYELTET